MATTFTDEDIVAAVNGMWILIAGVLCFMMQAGFGLLEVGMVRSKNAQNIMIKNLIDVAVAALSYYAVGYGIAYGEGGSPFLGQSYFFLNGMEDYIGWFFQFVFAGTTATPSSRLLFIPSPRTGFGVATAGWLARFWTMPVEVPFTVWVVPRPSRQPGFWDPALDASRTMKKPRNGPLTRFRATIWS
jgi:hypothetical protein